MPYSLQCRRCQEYKDAEEFLESSGRTWPKSPGWCKECRRDYQRDYRRNHERDQQMEYAQQRWRYSHEDGEPEPSKKVRPQVDRPAYLQ